MIQGKQSNKHIYSLVGGLVCFILQLHLVGYAQGSFKINSHDTTIFAGDKLTLSIDTDKLYSNFVFSARNPESEKWTIWAKNVSNKYLPLFNDQYNRTHVKVVVEKQQIFYVKYKTPAPGAMKRMALDSAWVCRSNLNGSAEYVLFIVPDFRKNAIYDLDVNLAGDKILYATGNDRFPDFTRDGDVFEYDLEAGTHTNLTNNWAIWSKYCRYTNEAGAFVFSHFTNFWYSNPTNIFLGHSGQPARQLTHNLGYTGANQFCTVTGFFNGNVLYRRGDVDKSSLFFKKIGGDEVLVAPFSGFGGIYLENGTYACTDTANGITLIRDKKVIKRFAVNEIESFITDNEYNYGGGVAADLNWSGKLTADVSWSTGAKQSAIIVAPNVSTTYKVKVVFNGKEYNDSVNVKVNQARAIRWKCMELVAPKGSRYQWVKDGQNIINANDSVFTPSHAGTYKVRVGTGSAEEFESSVLIISQKYFDSLSEASSKYTVKTDIANNRVLLPSDFDGAWSVVNQSGAIVLKGRNSTSINLPDYLSGTYTVLLSDEKCSIQVAHRIVIMH